MKLWKLIAVFVLALGLCGCKQAGVTQEDITAHYQNRSFSAEYTVTTHSGFCVEYQLSCIWQNDVAQVKILQPQSVAGITAVVQGAEAMLQYEDISLDAMLPEIPGYSPMDMLHQLLMDLQTSAEFSGKESGSVVLEYRSNYKDGTEVLKILTLDETSLDLQKAECYLDGSLILTLKMEKLQWL